LIPPVSVTMQPRVLAPVAVAALLAELEAPEALAEPPPDEAELLLLPHAATVSVAAAATAARPHALCFTLTSTGPGANKAPGLAFVLGCPAGYAWLCRV
jgi:hypothetical protein